MVPVKTGSRDQSSATCTNAGPHRCQGRGEVMVDSEPRGGRVTLKSVAEKAGVSLATASKVMNGRADVRESTRQTVAQAARDLGYQPKRRDVDRRRSEIGRAHV